MKIPNAVAVITGAASGIGRAVAAELAQRGAKALALVDHSPTVSEVAAEVNKTADRAVARGFSGDVTDEKFRVSVFKELHREYGMVNICIPAAGITRDRLAVKFDK